MAPNRAARRSWFELDTKGTVWHLLIDEDTIYIYKKWWSIELFFNRRPASLLIREIQNPGSTEFWLGTGSLVEKQMRSDQ
jgi:hypothetical protein